MEAETISVIIPNYNGVDLLREYLPKLLDTLSNSTYVNDYEVIVIDDASTDTSIEYLQSLSCDKLKYWINEKNSGFSKTINQGIRKAQGKYSLLLNNDMEIPSDFFDHTLPLFSDGNVFGVSTKICDKEGVKILEEAKVPSIKHGKLNYRNHSATDCCNTLYLCGGNALVDTSKLKSLDGFNELFSPFYFEDFDLSLRAWRSGWKCVYTNRTFCRHCHSTTIKRENNNNYVTKIFNRNKLILNDLHSKGMQYVKLRILWAMKSLICRIMQSQSHRAYLEIYGEYKKMRGEIDTCKKERYSKLKSLKPILSDVKWG